MRRILVIKHGALGDVVLATGPFAAIRKHHKDDHITLLTTPAFAEMLRASGYFDDIWIDQRSKLHQWLCFFTLIRKIQNGGFARIYDMQTSERTSWYFRMLRKPRPEWVGTAEGASHRHNTSQRAKLHTVERQKEQLAIAGIPELPKPNVDWLKSDISHFAPPKPYALIAAGGSSHRPGKRWPATHYGTLCLWLTQQGITPVLLGTHAEAPVLSMLEAMCLDIRNLAGRTSFADIAELARGAAFAVGNDTGPMHLIAVAGCPSLVLFSRFSDPALCAPRGPNVTVLREAQLADLLPQTVISRLEKFT